MEKNKKLSSTHNQDQEEILNYSLSSMSLHINRDDFKNDEKMEIYIKDKDKLLKEYIIMKKIGQGTFGVVVSAIHIKTNEKVAIKILEKEKIIEKANINRIRKEIDILKQLRHNNIVQLYNVIDTLTHIYLIMEYVNGIELFDYIVKNKRVNEYESCHFYQQIISGIEYLGKINIVHRDIKPENLLVDKNKKIKIVDFGLSNIYKNNELLTTACGSPFYAAPEMIKGEKYNGTKVDIWSSGIVLYAMLCGFLPFEDPDNEKLYLKIIEGNFDYPPFLSKEVIDLISHILNVNPNKRYDINEIKKHFWFNKINPKINMTEGLILNKYIIPYDEKIILYMSDKFNININEIKSNILYNTYNQITTTYYLLIKKKIRNKEDTIGNMSSNLFIEYIHDKKNLLSFYDYNIDNIINERINKNQYKNLKKIYNNKNNNHTESKEFNNNNYNLFNNSYNNKFFHNKIKMFDSSDNFVKNKKKYSIEKHDESNRNELRITKININNIIIPKNFLNYSEIKNKQKKTFFHFKDSNKSQDKNQNKNHLNKSEIKVTNNKNNKSFNKTQNIINNDLTKRKIENIYINLKKNNNNYSSIQGSPYKNQNIGFLNLTKSNINNYTNDLFIKSNINNKSQNKDIKDNKIYNNIEYINGNNIFNQTMRSSYRNPPNLKVEIINHSNRKPKKEILTSYRKKKVLSFSIQRNHNIISNEIPNLTNNLNSIRNNLCDRSPKNINIDFIDINNIPQSNNLYEQNYSPKSKLLPYKRIKIPNLSKKKNISGRTESYESNKLDDSNSKTNPTFINTLNNFNTKGKKRNCFNSMALYKEKKLNENEILFTNPIIEHIFDRNNINNNFKDNEEKPLTERNINNVNKEKSIFSNKFKTIYQKINYDKNKSKKNNIIISNNISNISNKIITNYYSTFANTSYNIYNNNTNNNNSINSTIGKAQLKLNKDLIKQLKPLNTNIVLFKKPKLNNNQKNVLSKNKIKNNIKIKEKDNIDKNDKNDSLQNNIKNIKNNTINKQIHNYDNKINNPFDLASLAFYDKENEIKNSLIKELNIKKVKYNERKNKISCFKQNLRFELNIEKIDKNLYVIRFLRNKERNSIYKDLFLNIINAYKK